MDQQWDDLFDNFGCPAGGFTAEAALHYKDLESLMQIDQEQLALEGEAAAVFSTFLGHVSEQREALAKENFKAGISFALWLTGTTLLQNA